MDSILRKNKKNRNGIVEGVNKKLGYKYIIKNVESQDLIEKCLKEIAYLNKIAALIEMAIFLLIFLAFWYCYYKETDINNYYNVNTSIKQNLFEFLKQTDNTLNSIYSDSKFKKNLIEFFDMVLNQVN
jgi:hypothetical protein